MGSLAWQLFDVCDCADGKSLARQATSLRNAACYVAPMKERGGGIGSPMVHLCLRKESDSGGISSLMIVVVPQALQAHYCKV